MTLAVEDIINRGVAEIRKTAFGDDNEESKSLPWSQSQAWVIVKQLAEREEVRSTSQLEFLNLTS